MNEQTPPTAADYFEKVLTEPHTAAAMLQHFDSLERDFLTIVGCQQAVFNHFPSVPTTRQIREFTNLMRRLYPEAIDTFAVATLIRAWFNPESGPISELLKSVSTDDRDQAMILIPHAVYIKARPTPDLLDLWVRRCLGHLEQARKKTVEQFGEDAGLFYRTILLDIEAPLDLLTDVGPIRWTAMVINAATGALHLLFANRDREEAHRELTAYLTTEHDLGSDHLAVLDELIAYAVEEGPLHPDTDLSRLCTVGILLPRAMMSLLRPSPLIVMEFLKTCKAADDAMTEHGNAP